MSFTPIKVADIYLNQNEEKVQKSILSYCKFLRYYVNSWKLVIEEAEKPVRNLSNLAEQLRHVERAPLHNQNDFEKLRSRLQYSIGMCIEEELCTLKGKKLSKYNQELKNKLTLMEKSTLEIDWERKSPLIEGNATQPKLSLLLELSLKHWIYIFATYNKIFETFKQFDPRKEKCVDDLEKAFKCDLDNKNVILLLALTQFIDE